MIGYQELIDKLEAIKEMGYVKTHRAGTTGIGKTLEDLLGVVENNIPGPNAAMIELKSARKNSSSMLTLFTKSSLPRKVNSYLLKEYGYRTLSDNQTLELHTTINAQEYNLLKDKPGFKINIANDTLQLVATDGRIFGYWDKTMLKRSFEKKLPKLLYIKADTKGSGPDEQFWFNEAHLLSGFSFDTFLDLLRQGVIKVDIRIGQYPDGRTHDHGTAFRVLPDKLDLCFEHREKIM